MFQENLLGFFSSVAIVDHIILCCRLLKCSQTFIFFHFTDVLGCQRPLLALRFWLLLLYRNCYGFERAIFPLYSFPHFEHAPAQPTFIKVLSLEPSALPWSLPSFPLWFETQTQLICLFESHSVPQIYIQSGALFKLASYDHKLLAVKSQNYLWWKHLINRSQIRKSK